MSDAPSQYHQRHQWLNDAAVDYHTELAKPEGVRDAERMDALRSDIWIGLVDYFKFLNCTKKSFGTVTPEDIVNYLIICTMEKVNGKGEPGWLEQFSMSANVPFLGFLHKRAEGATEHLKRKENPGSGRAQDTQRQYNKDLAKRREEFPHEDADLAKINVLNALGCGMDQIKNIEMLSALQIVSTEHPIGEGITLGDTIRDPEDGKGLSTIDRTTLQIHLDKMPVRYRRVLNSMLEGGIEGIHDVKFGERLSLAEKVVVFSTAMKVIREHTKRPDFVLDSE